MCLDESRGQTERRAGTNVKSICVADSGGVRRHVLRMRRRSPRQKHCVVAVREEEQPKIGSGSGPHSLAPTLLAKCVCAVTSPPASDDYRDQSYYPGDNSHCSAHDDPSIFFR